MTKQNGKIKAPTEPNIVEACKLIIETQRLIDRVVNLVEPKATTSSAGGMISVFDPKDERTQELHRLGGRLGELRATYFGRRDPAIYKPMDPSTASDLLEAAKDAVARLGSKSTNLDALRAAIAKAEAR